MPLTAHTVTTLGHTFRDAEDVAQVELRLRCTCNWTAGPFSNHEAADEAQAAHERLSSTWDRCAQCLGLGYDITGAGNRCAVCLGTGWVSLDPPSFPQLRTVRARLKKLGQRIEHWAYEPPGSVFYISFGFVTGLVLGLLFAPTAPEPRCFEDQAYIRSVHAEYCVAIDDIEDTLLREALSQPGN